MSAPDVFSYGEHQIRTVVVDGDPWFVAADVARVLGYSATAAMTRSMDDDEKGVHVLHTPGGGQELIIISEAGLYDAILRSRVDQAQQFKRWVKHEVLPAIRRTGSYGTPAELTRSDLARMVLAAEEERIAAVERAEIAEQTVTVLAQPAQAWTELASAPGDFTVSDAAKMLARGHVVTGPRKLFDYLANDVRWIFRRDDRWQAMQTAVNAGWIVERITGGYFDDITGERKQGKPQVRVTPAGIEKLLGLMGGGPGLPELSA